MHSSKAMAISEPRLDCMRMLSSGPMKICRPSTCELKRTPSSPILRSSAREKIWNPPLSVRMGPSQVINLCSPPSDFISSSPGRTCR